MPPIRRRTRRVRTYRRPISYARRTYYRRRRSMFRRRPIRARAMKRAGNLVRYTCKNNFNLFTFWPISEDTPSLPGYYPITQTSLSLPVSGLIHANRQFDRNIRDYQYVKFNYIAVKVTDVVHVAYSAAFQYGNPPQFIGIGVNDICGKIPLNINWDLEQDFTFVKGHEGTVDEEGFAQHPGTKQLRPNDRKSVSFVYRVPKVWKQFIHTDIVKNSAKIDQKFQDFMGDITGIKNIRAPYQMFFSIPLFWSTLLPSTGDKTVTVRTYIRGNAYLGVTFRGRRLMDDGTCTIGTCSAPLKQTIELPIGES